MSLYEAALFAEGIKEFTCAKCRKPMEHPHGEIAMASLFDEHDPYIWFFCEPCYGEMSLHMGMLMGSLGVAQGQEWCRVLAPAALR